MTSRGMKEAEMKEIANFILQVVDNIDNDEKLAEIKEEVKKLCLKFPLYD